MTFEEAQVFIGALMVQYDEKCRAEMQAIAAEADFTRQLGSSEAVLVVAFYEAGVLSGKNAEIRKAQTAKALLEHAAYQRMIEDHASTVIARKTATAERIGVESEVKLWRAWLAGRGSDLA